MEFTFRQIGVIHSPFIDKISTPIQPTRSEAVGIVEVFPQYTQGLQDIDEITHLILLYVFHKSEGYRLLVKPYLDDQFHGLFATRYQERPNPIGLSIVRLLHREDNKLMIKGVDVLDGTPLLDIKPYIPDFDLREGDPSGWYDNRSIRD